MKAVKMLRRVCSVAAVGVALGMAGSSTASAAVPEGFFGMVPSSTTQTSMDQMAASGVGSVRIQIIWRLIEPAPGQRNWSTYDNYIGNIAAAGLQATPLLSGTPPWLSPRGGPPIYSGPQRAAWTSFLVELAGRYGRNGSFWRDHPLLPYKPLVDWEVWNEPNLKVYWTSRPNPRDYARLLKLTGAAIHQADPTARMGLGGLFPPPRPRYGVSLTNFMERLYRVRGVRRAFDALSIHPFGRRPKDVIASVREARRVLNRHGDRRTPIWITELGWSTGGNNWRKSPFRASESSQAKFLRASYSRLLGSRRGLRLERLVWHGWQDTTSPGAPWTLFMGLLRSDGSPKPSLAAFSSIAR
jgi:hypothetical protein